MSICVSLRPTFQESQDPVHLLDCTLLLLTSSSLLINAVFPYPCVLLFPWRKLIQNLTRALNLPAAHAVEVGPRGPQSTGCSHCSACSSDTQISSLNFTGGWPLRVGRGSWHLYLHPLALPCLGNQCICGSTKTASWKDWVFPHYVEGTADLCQVKTF